MTTLGFALFDTAIGRFGIASSERGIRGVQFPEADESATRARLARRFATAEDSAPPADVQNAIDGNVELLRGEPRDLSGARLDMERVADFDRRVYAATRMIPPGETSTYGAIAAQLCARAAAREPRARPQPFRNHRTVPSPARRRR